MSEFDEIMKEEWDEEAPVQPAVSSLGHWLKALEAYNPGAKATATISAAGDGVVALDGVPVLVFTVSDIEIVVTNTLDS